MEDLSLSMKIRFVEQHIFRLRFICEIVRIHRACSPQPIPPVTLMKNGSSCLHEYSNKIPLLCFIIGFFPREYAGRPKVACWKRDL